MSIMKKIIAAITISVLCFNFTAKAEILADDYVAAIEFVAPYINDGDKNEVSRGNCIASIMKLIGVGEFTAFAQMYLTYYYAPLFGDVFVENISENDGYILAAANAGIASGYPGGGKNPYYFIFKPDQSVTIKECLTFMLRCLTDKKTLSWDNVMNDSKNFNLLTEAEAEFYSEETFLTNELFRTLLHRMLDKPRYRYCPMSEEDGWYAVQIDKEGSMKYIDLYSEYQSKGRDMILIMDIYSGSIDKKIYTVYLYQTGILKVLTESDETDGQPKTINLPDEAKTEIFSLIKKIPPGTSKTEEIFHDSRLTVVLDFYANHCVFFYGEYDSADIYDTDMFSADFEYLVELLIKYASIEL